jgi:hypothetical protein
LRLGPVGAMTADRPNEAALAPAAPAAIRNTRCRGR